VNAELGALIAADLSTVLDGSLLGVMMAAGASRAATFDIPASIRIWHDVVGFRSFTHLWISFLLLLAYDKFGVPNKNISNCHSEVKPVLYSNTEHLNLQIGSHICRVPWVKKLKSTGRKWI
jgi:hypothetical protein